MGDAEADRLLGLVQRQAWDLIYDRPSLRPSETPTIKYGMERNSQLAAWPGLAREAAAALRLTGPRKDPTASYVQTLTVLDRLAGAQPGERFVPNPRMVRMTQALAQANARLEVTRRWGGPDTLSWERVATALMTAARMTTAFIAVTPSRNMPAWHRQVPALSHALAQLRQEGPAPWWSSQDHSGLGAVESGLEVTIQRWQRIATEHLRADAGASSSRAVQSIVVTMAALNQVAALSLKAMGADAQRHFEGSSLREVIDARDAWAAAAAAWPYYIRSGGPMPAELAESSLRMRTVIRANFQDDSGGWRHPDGLATEHSPRELAVTVRAVGWADRQVGAAYERAVTALVHNEALLADARPVCTAMAKLELDGAPAEAALRGTWTALPRQAPQATALYDTSTAVLRTAAQVYSWAGVGRELAIGPETVAGQRVAAELAFIAPLRERTTEPTR